MDAEYTHDEQCAAACWLDDMHAIHGHSLADLAVRCGDEVTPEAIGAAAASVLITDDVIARGYRSGLPYHEDWVDIVAAHRAWKRDAPRQMSLTLHPHQAAA